MSSNDTKSYEVVAEPPFTSLYLKHMYFINDLKALGTYGTENQKGMKKLEVYSDDKINSVIIYKTVLIINGFAVITIVCLVPNNAWKLLFS